MHHSDFTRSVAKSTGEDLNVILGRGFSLVDDNPAVEDEDFEAMIEDWNMIRAEEIFASLNWGASKATSAASHKTIRAKLVDKRPSAKNRRHALQAK